MRLNTERQPPETPHSGRPGPRRRGAGSRFGQPPDRWGSATPGLNRPQTASCTGREPLDAQPAPLACSRPRRSPDSRATEVPGLLSGRLCGSLRHRILSSRVGVVSYKKNLRQRPVERDRLSLRLVFSSREEGTDYYIGEWYTNGVSIFQTFHCTVLR